MQRFRRPLLIIAAITGGLILLLAIASFVLAGKMKSIAVAQINRYLTVPVQVNEISFSLFRNFPNASVTFEGVRTRGLEVQGALNPLVEAKHIGLLYNLFDIFRDELHLKKIIIRDAGVYLFTDKNGIHNYDILRKNAGATSEFRVELEDVELENVHISFVDLGMRRDYRLHAKQTKLSGAFTSNEYDLNIKGPVFAERLRIGEVNYIDKKDLQLELLLHINREKNSYDIRKSRLQVADMLFDVKGIVSDDAEDVNVDLDINSHEAGIREVLSLIPGVYTEKLNKYRYDGKVEFNVKVKGKSGRNKSPLITAGFNAKNASLKPQGSDYTLKNISLSGDYTSRISARQDFGRLRLNNVRADLEGQPLSAQLIVEDFQNPYLDLRLKCRINLEVLSGFWMPDTLDWMKGEVIADATVKGRTGDKSKWISSGNLDISNVSLSIKKRKVDLNGINGRLTLQGSRLLVSNLKGNAAGSDFTFNGSIDNAYGYLLSKTETVNGTISMNSSNLDLNELLEDESSTATDTVYRFDLDPRIRMKLQTNIGMIRFRRFEGWQVKGTMILADKVLSADNLSFRGFEGTSVLSGQLDARRNDSLVIACEADLKRLDIRALFYQMGNFGQDVIVSENVSGKLTATIWFAGTWGKNLHCNLNRVIVKSNLLIENGELIQFKPILALNKYIKGADLQHIKFQTLKNQVEVRNQTIYIPAMEIKSSALDLTASGTHTFDNIIDYKLQMYLSQLMGKKVKSMNTEFGTIEDDGLGRMKIFLTMTGPMANPKVVFDKKSLEQKITQDVKKEKDEFRNILRREFGFTKKDTAPAVKPKPRQEELELELETGD